MVKKLSKLLSVFLIIAIFVSNIAVISYASNADYDITGFTTNVNQIAEELREAMLNRKTTYTIKYKQRKQLSPEEADKFFSDLFEEVYAETESSNYGDYLYYNTCGYSTNEDLTWAIGDGEYCYYNTALIIQYYTTAEQEKVVDKEVKRIIESFKFNVETTDKEKCDAIYRYIVKNVAYDRDNLNDDSYTLKFSAYAALIDGKAVCQGYASLFYRMAKECGLDVRVIAGYSRDPETNQNVGHAWNIVRLGEKYYYLDSTWDAGTNIYKYYLKGNNDFKNHISDEEFETEEFKLKYPIDVKNYDGHDFEITKENFREVYKCLICGYEYANLFVAKGETIAKGDDGKWYYVVDGVEYPDANTLIEYDGKLCYIKNGIWDKTVSNVIITYAGKHYYINKGVWDDNYTKIIKSGGKNLYIEKGLWKNSKTGFVKYEGKYRYIKNGEWASTTTFVKDGSKYWYVKSGIRTNTTGFVNYKGDYRYVVDGVWTKTTGFVKYGSKNYYVSKGVRSDKTGFVKVDGDYYMIKKGVKSSNDTYVKYKNTYLKLSSEQYSYNGKNKKPSVKIYDSSAKAISSKKYTVTLPKSTAKVGKYAVSIKFKRGYSGSTKLYFTIVPKATKLSKVSASKKALKITIKKETKEVTGYQIEYASSKDFKKAKKVKITKNKTTTLNIKNLKAKTGYYVRVRTYKTVGGKTYYSEWSKAVSKKTK